MNDKHVVRIAEFVQLLNLKNFNESYGLVIPSLDFMKKHKNHGIEFYIHKNNSYGFIGNISSQKNSSNDTWDEYKKRMKDYGLTCDNLLETVTDSFCEKTYNNFMKIYERIGGDDSVWEIIELSESGGWGNFVLFDEYELCVLTGDNYVVRKKNDIKKTVGFDELVSFLGFDTELYVVNFD